MVRRLMVLAGTLALLGALPATFATASAAPGTHAARVCPVSTSPARAECFSWVRTDAAGHALVTALPTAICTANEAIWTGPVRIAQMLLMRAPNVNGANALDSTEPTPAVTTVMRK